MVLMEMSESGLQDLISSYEWIQINLHIVFLLLLLYSQRHFFYPHSLSLDVSSSFEVDNHFDN